MEQFKGNKEVLLKDKVQKMFSSRAARMGVWCLAAFIVVTGIFFTWHQIKKISLVPESSIITRQVSGAVTNYQNVQWAKIVKLSNLNEKQKYVVLPGKATNIVFTKIDKEQALAFLQKPQETLLLELQNRRVLAGMPLPSLAQGARTQPGGFVPKVLFDVETKIVDAMGGNGQGQQNIDISKFKEQGNTKELPGNGNAQNGQGQDTGQEKDNKPADKGESKEGLGSNDNSEKKKNFPIFIKNKDGKEEVIEVSEGEYLLVEYIMPPPTLREEKTRRGKMVIVSDPQESSVLLDAEQAVKKFKKDNEKRGENGKKEEAETVDTKTSKSLVTSSTTNVVAFTTVPELFNVGEESKIKIEWLNEGGQTVPFTAHDLNANGKIDYIEWKVLHLSSQYFEIIYISKAFHLDSNREIVADIYNAVKEQDDTWATIGENQYVRVTFQEALESHNAITIYARSSEKNASIEVYEENTSNLIAAFPLINEVSEYRVVLADLAQATYVFDLKIINGAVDIDLIVDPAHSLVGYWKLDETSGTNAADSSGYGNAGTHNGGPTIQSSCATLNFSNARCLNLDGTDDYVDMANLANYWGGKAQLSLSLWIKPGTIANNDVIFDVGSLGFRLYATAAPFNRLNVDIRDGVSGGLTPVLETADNGIVEGAWNHIIVTIDGTNDSHKLYVNGTEKASSTAAFTVFDTENDNYVRIGHQTVAVPGDYDDVRLYTRVLSTTEISALAAGNHTTATWDGSSSTAYGTAANWDTNAIPDPYTKVVIATATNQPVLGAAESLNTLTINSGAKLDLAGYNLTFNDSGAFSNSGTLLLNNTETLTNFTNDTDSGTVVIKGTSDSTGFKTGNSYNNLTINDGLVGYWKLDEASGTNAADSSGYGNTGTLTNGPTISSSCATLNFTNTRCLSFDGTDDRVPTASTFTPPTGYMSISLWFRTSGNTIGILGWNNNQTGTSGVDDREFSIDADGKLRFFAYPDASRNVVSNAAVNNDQWHHAVVVINGSMTLYVDGTAQTDVAASTDRGYNSYATPYLILGRIDPSKTNSGHFSGYLDDIRVYNRALTAQEIQALAVGNQPATSAATITMNAAVDVNGDLTLNSGTLDTASGSNYGVTVAGSWWNNGGKFTPRSGTVTLDGTATGKTLLSGGQNFYDLTVSGSGGGWTLADRLEVDNTYAQSTGTVDTSSSNYAIVADDWDQTGGTFTVNSSTVTLNSADAETINTDDSLSTLQIEDPTESGLVGYWKLDEGQGTSAKDSSGNANTGTLTNTPFWSETVNSTTTYDNPYSMSFDGADDVVNVTNESNFDFERSNAFSMGGWVKTSMTGPGNLLSKGDNAGPNYTGYYLMIGADSAGQFTFFLISNLSNWIRVRTNLTYNDNSWHHVFITYNGSSNASGVSIYVDGVSVATTTVNDSLSSSILNNFNFTIGARSDVSYPYSGLIDDVRIYNRALSATEVANLAAGRYAAGDNSTATFTQNTALTASTLRAQSGNLTAGSNNLTVTNLVTQANGNGVLTSSNTGSTTTLNGGLTVSGGTFTGSSGTLDVNGDLTLSSGTLTAPSGTLAVSGTFNRSGGTFTHNSGTVVLDNTSSKTLTNSQSFNNLAINDGLIGYWKLDETAANSCTGGSNDSCDSSGYGNDGAWNGDATANSTVASLNFTNARSVTFDGTGDYVNMGDASTLEVTGDMSVCAWVKTTTAQSNTGIISKWASNQGWLLFAFGSSQITFQVDTSDYRATANITDNVWTHACGVRSGTTIYLYLNGSQSATDAGTSLSAATSVSAYIGTYTGTGEYFNGNIDDVRIYNRALSATEISRLAAGNQPQTTSATTTLASAITTASNLMLNSGTLDVSAAGCSSASCGVTVTGNFENNGGVFTPRTGTVTLNGTDQGINASNTFYNLTKSVSTARTLTFGQGSTTTINSGGTLTLAGASGQLLSLRSAVTSTAWKLTQNGTSAISYVDVKDSDASTGTAISQTNSTDSGNNTNWAFNSAPSITAGPSDGSSSGTTPTNVGSNVTFTATATDSDSDNYYLAVCKTNSVTAANNAAPTCGGGNWGISSSTASGVAASVTYTALAGDSESNAWFAFVCDHDASSLCSSASQGSGDSGSPFKVNHTPSFSAVSYSGSAFGAGASIQFTATASDSDTDTTSDTVTLYLCKSNDFTGSACGSAGTWCSSSASSSDPSCAYTVQISDGTGSHNYYGYIIDNHSFASTSNPQSGSFTTEVVAASSGSQVTSSGSSAIQSSPQQPAILPPILPPTPFIEQLIDELKKVQEQFKDLVLPEKKVVLSPAEQFVQKETPLSMKGDWNLLSPSEIKEFTLAPLPDELVVIAKKLPKFSLVLNKLGIEKMTEVEKLKNVKLILPGINEAIGALPGQSFASLTDSQRGDIPTEIVFVKSQSGLIDISPLVSLGQTGEIKQSIELTSGKSLELIVRPAHTAESVKGQITLLSKKESFSVNENIFQNFFAATALAADDSIERRLVLQEFSYEKDKDDPRIYRAMIDVPLSQGEYEIITEIEYEDKRLGRKEIEMITLIDPEGYVYRRLGDSKLPLKNAKVSLYWLDQSLNQYQLWDAKNYSQENPQLTDERGNYSFLVPEGNYYIVVELAGYMPYQSDQFQVREGAGVRFNIELEPKYWWLKTMNWETALLIIMAAIILWSLLKGRLVRCFRRVRTTRLNNTTNFET